MTAGRRRRPLTAKVRRGLSFVHAHAGADLETLASDKAPSLSADEQSDVRAALAWIGQFMATPSTTEKPS